MKRHSGILVILLAIGMLFISSCASEVPYGGKGVSVKVVDPKTSGLATVQDLPFEVIPQTLSVKELVEHRSALHDKTVTVKGIIIEAIIGEKACPSKKIVEGGIDIAGCAQSRIIIADNAGASRDKRYDVIVLVKDDDQNYAAGQSVEAKVKVSASKVAVNLERVY